MRDDRERVLASWRALDERFERVRPTPWGAVVTDRRFPLIHDVNYARIERPLSRLRLEAVEADLRDELVRAGATYLHTVTFEPDRATTLLAEASSLGATLSWEIVMTRDADRIDPRDGVHVTEVRTFGVTFARAFRRSVREFGTTEPRIADQIEAIEERVLRPAGKRWFTVRPSGRPAAFGSLLVLGDAALIDHVVTLPHARRRGYADAIVRRLCEEARAEGARICWLITDPDGHARQLYERLGFRKAGTIGSTLRPFVGDIRTRGGRPSRGGTRGSRTTAR